MWHIILVISAAYHISFLPIANDFQFNYRLLFTNIKLNGASGLDESRSLTLFLVFKKGSDTLVWNWKLGSEKCKKKKKKM